MKTVRVGTRKSPLAIKQTMIVIDLLKSQHPTLTVDIVPMTTKGDRLQSADLTLIGGKGVFITEVEQALLTKQIDFAVHSLKDMPAKINEALTLAALPKRSDPTDCIIFREVSDFTQLPFGAKIGTSSLRRAFQIKNLRADLQVVPIRGNIGTRLKRMAEEKLDGIVLATAGLKRLEWFLSPTHAFSYLTSEQCIPAVGQGVLAVECRKNDVEMLKILQTIDDALTRTLVTEERDFLRVLDGNCDIPIGAYASKTSEGFRFAGFLGNKQTQESVTEIQDVTTITGVGSRMAKRLLGKINR